MTKSIAKVAVTCAALSAVLGAGVAQAGYRMTAFGNTAGFEQIMSKQYEAIKQDLASWQGDMPQTDDVLLIGLRVNGA